MSILGNPIYDIAYNSSTEEIMKKLTAYFTEYINEKTDEEVIEEMVVMDTEISGGRDAKEMIENMAGGNAEGSMEEENIVTQEEGIEEVKGGNVEEESVEKEKSVTQEESVEEMKEEENTTTHEEEKSVTQEEVKEENITTHEEEEESVTQRPRLAGGVTSSASEESDYDHFSSEDISEEDVSMTLEQLKGEGTLTGGDIIPNKRVILTDMYPYIVRT